MPTFGHLAVGLAAERSRRAPRSWSTAIFFAGLSALPDLDLISWPLHLPQSSPLAHRGAAHSLAAAGLVALAAYLVQRLRGRPARALALVAFGLVASHGLLDALASSGMGVELFWPFSSARVFAPVRPIPAVSITDRLRTSHGLLVLGAEALIFSPLIIYGLWPRRAR